MQPSAGEKSKFNRSLWKIALIIYSTLCHQPESVFISRKTNQPILLKVISSASGFCLQIMIMRMSFSTSSFKNSVYYLEARSFMNNRIPASSLHKFYNK